MNLEDYFYELAVLYGKKAVILYDRGVMDPRAYMDDTTWQGVLDDSGWNPVYLRTRDTMSSSISLPLLMELRSSTLLRTTLPVMRMSQLPSRSTRTSSRPGAVTHTTLSLITLAQISRIRSEEPLTESRNSSEFQLPSNFSESSSSIKLNSHPILSTINSMLKKSTWTQEKSSKVNILEKEEAMEPTHMLIPAESRELKNQRDPKSSPAYLPVSIWLSSPRNSLEPKLSRRAELLSFMRNNHSSWKLSLNWELLSLDWMLMIVKDKLSSHLSSLLERR